MRVSLPSSAFMRCDTCLTSALKGMTVCLQAAKEIAKRVDSGNRSVGDRVTAFALLARFRNLTSEESQLVFDLPLHGLNDPDPYVRMQASSAFATLGDRNAIPYLEAAISREKDENIRTTLTINLSELRQKMKR